MSEENTASVKLGRRFLNLLKDAFTQDELKTYYHVALSQWGKLHDVQKLSEKLQENFTLVKTLVSEKKIPSVVSELKGAVPEIEFKADNLFATVAPSRAVLFQKERKPFTRKDLELRKTILEWYPFKFNLPLFAKEPKFETYAEEIQVSKKGKEKTRRKKKEE